jgi:hypothetical protein
MPNDAKLGLVLGVAIVLVIALVFFRSEPMAARPTPDAARATTALPNDPVRPPATSLATQPLLTNASAPD